MYDIRICEMRLEDESFCSHGVFTFVLASRSTDFLTRYEEIQRNVNRDICTCCPVFHFPCVLIPPIDRNKAKEEEEEEKEEEEEDR